MQNTTNFNLFLEGNTTLWGLIEEISITESLNKENILNAIENNESDEGMILTVLLWSTKNSPLQNIKETNNSFIKFLYSIREENSNFYNEDISWVYNNENTCTYQKDNLLFIINNTTNDSKMQLPDEYCNQTVMCLNCNEEHTVDYFITVPAKSFYIIERIK